MGAYRVALHGCDDTTYIDIDLTDDEAAAIGRVAAASDAESEYGCMPTLTITRTEEPPAVTE